MVTIRRSAQPSIDAPEEPAARPRAAAADIWRALGTVPDPELPFVSIVELGIVRNVESAGGQWVVTITPTYSGCPAMRVIETDIHDALESIAGVPVHVATALAPAWTTRWIAPEATRKLRAAGIATPPSVAGERWATVAILRRAGQSDAPGGNADEAGVGVRCPRCGSERTARIAQFGSTACKALYRCGDCLEPFDYLKPH